jgi:ubiquinone/menaquinone biosynthesis C-methylase UbiE
MQSAKPADRQRLAFGVDPRRPQKYSLRQSRYFELGGDVARLARQAKGHGQRLQFLDVGFAGGVSMRYIETNDGAENIDYHGVELKLCDSIYKHDRWSGLWEGDLMQGLPFLESDRFDVVICEQVLEHLDQIDLAMSTLQRVLKPGGTLIVGVPIFPPGLHLVRRHLIPVMDRMFRRMPAMARLLGAKTYRGHVQAFSKNSFIADLRRNTDLEIQQARGFRIISGGLLAPLENLRAWWQLARFVGSIVPGLCIEIQVVAKKPKTTAKPLSTASRAAA